MGGPKALLAIEGERGETLPLAIAHAWALRAAGAERVCVVVRAPVAEVLDAALRRADDTSVELVVSRAPDEDGPRGSLLAALEHLVPDGSAWLAVQPVDAPPIARATMARMLAAREEDDDVVVGEAPSGVELGGVEQAVRRVSVRHGAIDAVRPTCGGRRGHPVLVRAHRLAMLRDEARSTLRDVLAASGVVDVETGDEACLVGLDRASDFHAWYGRPPSFVPLASSS